MCVSDCVHDYVTLWIVAIGFYICVLCRIPTVLKCVLCVVCDRGFQGIINPGVSFLYFVAFRRLYGVTEYVICIGNYVITWRCRSVVCRNLCRFVHTVGIYGIWQNLTIPYLSIPYRMATSMALLHASRRSLVYIRSFQYCCVYFCCSIAFMPV